MGGFCAHLIFPILVMLSEGLSALMSTREPELPPSSSDLNEFCS